MSTYSFDWTKHFFMLSFKKIIVGNLHLTKQRIPGQRYPKWFADWIELNIKSIG